MTQFLRARQPDQISLRRDKLLEAAAELFDIEGPGGAGLNAIAKKAGFTKSNVYRYFESREDVLLYLFLAEFDQLSGAAETAILAQECGDSFAVADAFSRCFIQQPRCCHLMSIFSSVLEQNVSEAKIASVKRHLATQSAVIVAALVDRLPRASPQDCGWALAMTSALVAGMWPGVHPSPAAAKVLAKEEFAHMLLKPERDLTRSVAALLESISSGPPLRRRTDRSGSGPPPP
jgi:TetR/AcrR family transcriptional regulator